MHEHTERLFAASARQLNSARLENVSEELRISAAFLAGYNALQAVQVMHPGPLEDHPLPSLVKSGAALVQLSESDLTLGLRLLKWEDHARYLLDPSPASVDAAIEWAERVRDAALKLLASATNQADKRAR